MAQLYSKVLEQNDAFVREGRIAEATQRLLDVVPATKRTAVHNLYLGNLLFSLDPRHSYERHLEALRQQPDSTAANLEAALDLQRAGQGAAACVLYDRVVARRADNPAINALWAHCLLEKGDLRRAIDAWKHADHPNRHVAIEQLIAEVFGPPNPWAVRSELIDKVNGPSAEKWLAALLRHDLEWKVDWWNSHPSLDLARRDLETLGDRVEPEVRQSMALLLEAAEGHASPDSDLRRRVREQLAQRDMNLPTQVLRGLVDFGLRGGMMTAEEAFAWLGPTLEKRVLSSSGSADEAEFLAALAAGRDDELLAKMDRLGWERFKNQTCAESRFLEMARAGELTPSDPGFRVALQALPESSILHRLALDLTPAGTREEQEAIRRLILADFHNLTAGDPALGERTSYGIKDLFSRLERSLETVP